MSLMFAIWRQGVLRSRMEGQVTKVEACHDCVCGNNIQSSV